MDIQKEKPRGLPNPYALGGLPNPYPLRTGNEAPPSKPAGEQEKLEEKKTTGTFPHSVLVFCVKIKLLM